MIFNSKTFLNTPSSFLSKALKNFHVNFLRIGICVEYIKIFERHSSSKDIFLFLFHIYKTMLPFCCKAVILEVFLSSCMQNTYSFVCICVRLCMCMCRFFSLSYISVMFLNVPYLFITFSCYKNAKNVTCMSRKYLPDLNLEFILF